MERALALLQVRPADAIFFGDSPHDMASGHAAGVYTVGVTWGASTREEMATSKANVLINAVAEMPDVVGQFQTAVLFKPYALSEHPTQCTAGDSDDR